MTGAAVVAEGDAVEDEFSNSELVAGIDSMVDAAFDKVDRISFKALGSIGLILLLWTVIEVMSRVESSFNRVWGVPVGRSFWRKFTDYLSVLLIVPFLLMAAWSLPVADMVSEHLRPGIAAVVGSLMRSPLLRHLNVVLMMSLCFTFLMMFMPNTPMDLLHLNFLSLLPIKEPMP